jgi:peptidoglycan/xylan/chitin deacetylase (PgdA/CDA1 family)
VTSQLPILAYHRVSRSGGERTAGVRLTPRAFEEQLQYLGDSGFRCVSLEEWRRAAASRLPIPRRAIALTFDDAYVDFAEYAWPLLQKYGFSASLFVVTDLVGSRSRWDSALGEEVPLLDWPELRRLQAEGVEIGSHSATHRPLVGLQPADVVREASGSRATLGDELGKPVSTFAYPFGLANRSVQHLVGACGYVFGLTCADRPVRWQDPLLALPRRPVPGSVTLSSFIRRLPG